MPTKKHKKHPSKNPKKRFGLGIEFFKLQVAGNVPFWGTYLIYALLDNVFSANEFFALLFATAAANAVFFIIDDQWVFHTNKKQRKLSSEIRRFILFITFSSLLTFIITWQLYDVLNISPYIGQFITAILSILWTFTGLKFWVFAPTRTRAKA